jgi:hypothetical protein
LPCIELLWLGLLTVLLLQLLLLSLLLFRPSRAEMCARIIRKSAKEVMSPLLV